MHPYKAHSTHGSRLVKHHSRTPATVNAARANAGTAFCDQTLTAKVPNTSFVQERCLSSNKHDPHGLGEYLAGADSDSLNGHAGDQDLAATANTTHPMLTQHELPTWIVDLADQTQVCNMYADVLPCFPADHVIPSSHHEDDPCATRHEVKTHVSTGGIHRNSVPNDSHDDYVQNDML